MAMFSVIISALAVVSVVSAHHPCNTAVQEKCMKKDPGLTATACLKKTCPLATTGSLAFRKRMVDGHNGYRLKPFTNGSYGGDMIKLTWDDELAAVALSWAHDLCIRDAFEHDAHQCRSTASYSSVGQNLMCGSGLIYADELHAADAAMRVWFDEIELQSPEDMFPFRWNPPAGHYTTMVWSRTYKMGCGFVKIPDKIFSSKVWLACDYAPGGNVLGGGYNVFKPSSAPATDCMPGTVKGDSGLCEVTDEAKLREHVGLSFMK